MGEFFERLKQNRLNWDAVAVLLAGASPLFLPSSLILFVDGIGCLVLVTLGAFSLRHELKTEGQPDDWKVWSVVLPLMSMGVLFLTIQCLP